MSLTKKIPVTLVLHLEWEVRTDVDEKWVVEENLCLDNLVKQIPSVENDECNTCSKGFAVVGHVKRENIK